MEMEADWEKHQNSGRAVENSVNFTFPDSTLEWALEFVQKELGNLRLGEYLDLQIDVNSLCGGGMILGSIPPSRIWPDEKLLQFQEEVLKIFRTFIREGFIEIDVEAVKVKMRAGVNKEEPRKGLSYFSERSSSNMPTVEQGLIKIVRALGEIGHFLKECGAPKSRGAKEDLKCGNLFLGRKNRTFCSPACQNRAATHANRRTIKEKSHRIRGKSYKSPGEGWVPVAVILTPAKGSGETEMEVPLPGDKYFDTRGDADQFAYEFAKKLIKETDAKDSP